jgi:hypothetical protein
MDDMVKKALRASRESKRIEFKRGFEASAPGSWCELIKDIVALANSGGGIVVFGLDSTGAPAGESIGDIANLDPADVSNKLAKYIGTPNFEIEGFRLKKRGQELYAFAISGTSIPHVFEQPGTYDIGGGKQKSAFGLGTLYSRHGAKSEPGTTDDLRASMDRALSGIRKSWIKGVRQVVQAPQGAEIVTIQRTTAPTPAIATSVRAVGDPLAGPVVLTRDPSRATGTIYYEEIAEGIFEEINNVIDANKALAKGQKRFFLGAAIYYRIYAERQHVLQQRDTHELLLRTAVLDFYAPALFWMTIMPEDLIAESFAELYRNPMSPQVHSLVRLATVLGDDFSKWLLGKMDRKWAAHPQPPTFYWTFKSLVQDLHSMDYRWRSSRFSTKSRIELPGEDHVDVADLLDNPPQAAALLSRVCMMIFEGTMATAGRAIARNLDYLAYGAIVRERGKTISAAIVSKVGDEQIGELAETPGPQETGPT